MANSFIKFSKSLIKAFIFFNKKLDSSFWVCVDYQKLNKLTIKNQYSLLLVKKFLDWLGWAWRFTQLNLTSAYYRMRICKRDEWKTIFQTRCGHFKYQVMSFELTNSPATFQGYINKIIVKKLNVFVIIYLNDIFIDTKNKEKNYV